MTPGARGARLPHDWFGGVVPPNVVVGRDAYVETSYGFDAFASTRAPGLVLGEAAGAYDRATFAVGPDGQVTVGAYAELNGVTVFCHDRVTIGAYALLAWGVVITDSWLPPGETASLEARRAVLRAAASDPERRLPALAPPRPVAIEAAVWVGFDAVILPGVTLGRGCVVGAKCVIAEDVPPYAVVAGNPPRVVRVLPPTDAPP